MKKIALALFITIQCVLSSQCPVAPVTLSNQNAVTNFSVTYPGCSVMPVGADLIITGTNITNLNGLSGLQIVNGAVEIRNNPLLTSTSGFAPLFAGSDFIIRNNAQLQNISSLSNMDTVAGEFSIRTNPNLTSLTGLNSLTHVGLALIIRDNATLTNLNGLDNVRTVGEVLELIDNPLLTDVSALSAIDSITGGDEGALVIEGNSALPTLQGLGNSNTKIKGDVTIANNTLLTYCSVISVCNYINNLPTGAIATINTNNTGCNTIPEVQSQCLVLNVEDHISENEFELFPNPAGAFVEVLNQLNTKAELFIINTLGEVVAKQTLLSGKNKVLLEQFSAGIYSVVFINDGTVFTKKLVIN